MEAPGANPDQEADLESMEQVRRGDAAGAARLFQRYAAPLLRFTGRILGDPAEAEEITQDVFLKLMVRADQYDGRAPVASWLFAIATNACRDRLRRSVRRPSVALEAVAEVGEPGIAADERLALTAAARGRAAGPLGALFGAARGARPCALSRDALRGNRKGARHQRRRGENADLPGHGDAQGPFFRRRLVMECRQALKVRDLVLVRLAGGSQANGRGHGVSRLPPRVVRGVPGGSGRDRIRVGAAG